MPTLVYNSTIPIEAAIALCAEVVPVNTALVDGDEPVFFNTCTRYDDLSGVDKDAMYVTGNYLGANVGLFYDPECVDGMNTFAEFVSRCFENVGVTRLIGFMENFMLESRNQFMPYWYSLDRDEKIALIKDIARSDTDTEAILSEAIGKGALMHKQNKSLAASRPKRALPIEIHADGTALATPAYMVFVSDLTLLTHQALRATYPDAAATIVTYPVGKSEPDKWQFSVNTLADADVNALKITGAVTCDTFGGEVTQSGTTVLFSTLADIINTRTLTV